MVLWLCEFVTAALMYSEIWVVPSPLSHGLVKLHLFPKQFFPLKQGVILSPHNAQEAIGDWEMNCA